MITLAAGLLFCGYAGSAIALESREIGVVEAAGLNLRTAPSLSSPSVRTLEKGSRVRILKEENDWLQIVHEGDIGYIYNGKDYVKRYVIHTVKKEKDNELEMARAKAMQIAQKIKTGREEISGFEKKEKNVLDELEAIDRDLSSSRDKLGEIRKNMSGVDERIGQIKREVEKTRTAIDKRKGYGDLRLSALYKLNRLGAMNLLASADSMQEMFRRRAAIQAVVGHDEKVIERLVNEKERLTKLLTRLNEEKGSKIALENQYRVTLAQLVKKKGERKNLLYEIKAEKTNRLAMIDYLQSAARQMEKTMAALNPGDYHARKVFSEYQGLLKLPVKGKVIGRFGKFIEPQSGVASFRNGIEIQSQRGAPVRVVFAGKTIFADWLKGYGRVIIVAHGSNYYTVYAHVDEIFCVKGETVEAGEVIATVGDTGSIIGPALYFEVRHHGNPINPLVWMDNG